MSRLYPILFVIAMLIGGTATVTAQSLFDERNPLLHAESVGVSSRLGDVTLASFPTSDPQDFIQFTVLDHDHNSDQEHIVSGDSNTTVAYPFAAKVFDRTVSSIGYYEPISREVVWRHPHTTGKFHDSSPAINTSAGDPWPVAGDWNGDGFEELGIFDRDTGIFERFDSSYSLIGSTNYSIPGFYPFIGDWDQDGLDDFGAFNASTLQFRLYTGLSFSTVNAAGVGSSNLRPVAGDWNGDGKDSVGACSESNGRCYLFYDLASTSAWDAIVSFNTGLGSVAIAGQWDSDLVHRLSIPDTSLGQPLKTFPIVRQTDAGTFGVHVTGKVENFTDPPFSESMLFIEHGSSLHDNRSWIGSPLEYAPETGATALGAVLDDDSAVFKHPNGTYYRYLSYFVTEHPEAPGQTSIGGWACLRYSQDGLSWTEPIFATRDPSDNNPTLCKQAAPVYPEIAAEIMTAMWDGASIFAIWFNGDVNEIVTDFLNGVDRSHTYLALASPEKPWYFDEQGELITKGINAQSVSGFMPYAPYGINLDYSYDPTEDVSYFSRTYPYPFDINGSIPCKTSLAAKCPTAVTTNPNRVQLYRFRHQGLTLQDKIDEIIDTGSEPAAGWELVFDIGTSHSYPYDDGSGCRPHPIPDEVKGAVDVGLDINSASLVKSRNGFVHRFEDGKMGMTLGGAIPRDRTWGECDFKERNVFSFYFDPGPKLETGRVTVGGEPVTVELSNTFLSPVVVATVHYRANHIISRPVVTRISNVTPTSFDLRLQNPSGLPVYPDKVSYVVVEEGSWVIDGMKVEAQKYVSTVTDHNESWVGEAQTYLSSFNNPVVLGQVMSENDPDYSVFWSRGAGRFDPPSSSMLYTGKTVNEDPDLIRADETIGFVVFEAGHGTIAGVEMEAGLGLDQIFGEDDGPPFNYDYSTPFPAPPLVTLASMAGMDGGNGGWAQVHWSQTTMGTADQLSLSIDEDTINDPERSHTSEQVAYLAFLGPTIYPSPGAPVAEWGTAQTNDTAPHRVYFSRTYNDPVVVATIHYENNVGPMVTRISNVTNSSFDVRLQSPSGGIPPQAETISYMVAEAGDWQVDGVKISAFTYISTVTDHNLSWVGEAQTYGQSFSNPVVLGQVMSENDPKFSVFWNRGNMRENPPSASTLFTGKSVCEDSDRVRADETVGVIVIETADTVLGGVPMKAAVGADTILGFDDLNAPYTYNLTPAFSSAPSVALATMAGVDGANGGWAYVFGTTSSTLDLVIDEDLIFDTERNHTSEQVGYVLFQEPGSISQ